VPPELIAGRYRVEREVGRGGMGSVWLCRDERLDRSVAVKQVGGLPGESSLHLARALREARHSAALNHPNVVAIFDAIEDGDQVWLVMEYVPSRTLDQMVREDGPLEPRLAARIAADVADGLAAAHGLGTVHRDVKPSNILVRESDGHALIADFGIARTVGQEQLTRSGLVTGTPVYFAPELARGYEPSPASDVWALGVSLYVAVEGEPPYSEQSNAIALLNTIANQPPPQPSRAGPLTTVMRQMLDPDPESRCTMLEAAKQLHRVAEERPAETRVLAPAEPILPPADSGPPDTVPTRTVPAEPPRRRGPALVALTALVVLALVGLGGWWLTRDADEPSADGSGPKAAGPRASQPAGSSDGTPSAGPSETSEPPSPEPSATESSPGVGSSTAPPPVAGAGSPTELVADYYTLLPEDTDAAWELLTPELQQEFGESGFRGFWATVDEVEVGGTETVDDGVVQVSLTYITDGRAEQETRQLGVEQTDDGYLISDDMGAV
jgi:serine/threonine protein kinase